jgi:hypothetical protein
MSTTIDLSNLDNALKNGKPRSARLKPKKPSKFDLSTAPWVIPSTHAIRDKKTVIAEFTITAEKDDSGYFRGVAYRGDKLAAVTGFEYPSGGAAKVAVREKLTWFTGTGTTFLVAVILIAVFVAFLRYAL